MAREKCLIDTNIVIEILHGRKQYRDFFLSEKREIFIAKISVKELYKKKGMPNQEKQFLSGLLKIFSIIIPDHRILSYYALLKSIFEKHGLTENHADRLIAATALARQLPLLTLNRKHFSFIKGLKLVHLP